MQPDAVFDRLDVAALDAQRQLADALPVLVMVSDADGVVQFFNRRWHEFTGQGSFDTDRGEGWQRFLHPDDGPAVRDAWYSAVSRGDHVVRMRYRLRYAPTGEYRWFDAQAVAVVDTAGTIVRWIGAAVDVHDEVHAQRALLRALDTQTAVAGRYQRAALPAAFPQSGSLRFDAEYDASGDALLVGGDWYDVFELGDGRIAVSVGDVVGHGVDAAITMAKLRQSGRAVAIWSARHAPLDPAGVLDAMEQTLTSDPLPEAIATAIVGVIEADGSSFTYASAGHPPPLMKHGDGTVTCLDAGGTLLGCGVAGRPTHTVALDDAAAIVLYTDGAIEGERDLDRGLDALMRTLARVDVRGDRPAAAILAGAHRNAGDDAAVLVIARERSRSGPAR